MEEIIQYIKEKYNPSGIIVYGSYADGSNNENSDFDAMVIANVTNLTHDNNVINGVELDVFIYPIKTFEGRNNWEDFRQIYNGQVVFDTDGISSNIVNVVRNFMDNNPQKTKSEIQTNIEWCEKMLLRTQRNDTEGYYRWHWLLTDSLEIYFELTGQIYFGPKKSIRKMQMTDTIGFELYEKALKTLDYYNLQQWVCYLRKLFILEYA